MKKLTLLLLAFLSIHLQISCSEANQDVVQAPRFDKIEAKNVAIAYINDAKTRLSKLSQNQLDRLSELATKSSKTALTQDEMLESLRILGFSSTIEFQNHQDKLNRQILQTKANLLTRTDVLDAIHSSKADLNFSNSCESRDACYDRADADYWFRGVGCVASGAIPGVGLAVGIACAILSYKLAAADYEVCRTGHTC